MQNPLNQQSKSLSAADILLSLVAKVAEQTAHSVIVTDAKHCIVWVNEGFSQLRGHSLDFAKGKTPGSLLASELSDKAVLAQIAQAVANQQALRCELQSHDRCGNAIWLDIEIRPIFNTAGKLEGFSQFETNITALVTAKQDLVKERARLDELAEGIEAGLGQWDITNDTVTFNNRLTSMLGDPKGSWINAEGIKWRARCHPDDVDHLSEIFQRICSGKESQISTELRLKHANQNWLSMMVRAHVTERLPNGEPKGISGIYIDVTEKREQDRKLHEAKEAAEAANQAKSSFLATMSHEIRTVFSQSSGRCVVVCGRGFDWHNPGYARH